MKKIILSAALVAIAGFTYAQKPAAGDVTGEVTMYFQTGTSAVSIWTPDLKARYFLSDDMALRIDFAVATSSSSQDVTEAAPGTGTGKYESSSSTFIIGAGIEKHFAGTERLSPYVGAGLSFSTGSSDETFTNCDNFGGGLVYTPDYLRTEDNASVSTFGLKLMAGADYYFVNNVYLGIEVGWGFSTTSNGDATSTTTSGGTTTVSKTPGGSSSGLSLSYNPGLRFGFVF
ncbi:MAG: hypothetical protein U0X76_01605 [Bacteroidia bacterium]